MTLHGLLLAAGAGSRMGRPKALVRDEAGEPWLVRGVRALRDGGCDAVDRRARGAAPRRRRPLLDGHRRDVGASPPTGPTGMSASLRAGLRAAADDRRGRRAVVTLVDLPDVHADVVRRVAAPGRGPAAAAPRDVRRPSPATRSLLGRDHWAGVLASATGDRGARDYLATQAVDLVECGDLATGRDQDTR